MVSSREYKVLDAQDRGNFKFLHLLCLADDTQHTVTAFNDYNDYDKLEKDNVVTGWIRRNGSYYNLVSYIKPERNWKTNEEYL